MWLLVVTQVKFHLQLQILPHCHRGKMKATAMQISMSYTHICIFGGVTTKRNKIKYCCTEQEAKASTAR